MIRIFTRKTWVQNNKYPYGFAPYATARKQTIKVVETESEARDTCQDHNKNRPEYGKKGYFTFSCYEFESL